MHCLDLIITMPCMMLLLLLWRNNMLPAGKEGALCALKQKA